MPGRMDKTSFFAPFSFHEDVITSISMASSGRNKTLFECFSGGNRKCSAENETEASPKTKKSEEDRNPERETESGNKE